MTPPMCKKPGAETPYVGLSLKLGRTTLEPGDTVNAVFELSVYNHAKKMYCGRRGIFNCFFVHVQPITVGIPSLVLCDYAT